MYPGLFSLEQSSIQGVRRRAGAVAYDPRKGTALPADVAVQWCAGADRSSEASMKCL
jgi:hypothetical protein